MIFKQILSFGVGFGLTSGIGGYIIYQRRLKENKSIDAKQFNEFQNQDELNESIQLILNKNKKAEIDPNFKLIFYRYSTCPFCNKVEAFMKYNNIPYDVVEVEPMFKKELSNTEYKKVPQLQFQNNKSNPYLVDSDLIIDEFEKHMPLDKHLKKDNEQKWRNFASDTLVKHLVININKSLLDAWKGYEYVDKIDTIPFQNKLFLKSIGAPVMYLVSEYVTKPKLIKSNEITGEKNENYMEILHKKINYFIDEGVGKNDFVGGKKPNLGDIEVYGVLQSIRNHKVYNDILNPENTKIKKWLDSMDQLINKI